MRYLINRWHVPVAVLDVDHEQIFLVSATAASRDGQSWYDSDGDEQWSSGRTLIASKCVYTELAEFELVALASLFR